MRFIDPLACFIRTLVLWPALLLASQWLVGVSCFAQGDASDAADSTTLLEDPADVQSKIPAEAPAKVEDAKRDAEIDRLIEQLASNEFARRERAAAELMTMGVEVIPRLKTLIADASDAEVRLRAQQIVQQLTRGDMQTRIDDFLAGRDVDFDGWIIFQSMMGDNGTNRILFVELLKSHPELVASLEGTTRDRVLALEKVIATVQNRMFVELDHPTRADAFALLFPIADPNVPITAGYESVLLSVLQKEAASKIRDDAQLSPNFKSLMARWIVRSTLSSRIDVLLVGMEWDVQETLSLAVLTLSEANQTETISTALQAIARFGAREHSVFVVPLLDDSRPSSETDIAGGNLHRSELRDVAMVTIALLYDADLKEIGFDNVATHPVYGFIVSDIGFPVDDPKPREAARKKIDQLLKTPTPVEGS